MPMYTYTCPSCGHKATAIRKVAERDLPLYCGHGALPPLDLEKDYLPMTRDIAGPAFALKGKGWARDGYKG